MSESYESSAPLLVADLVADAEAPILAVAPADHPWREMFLVCAKCAKKIGAPALVDGHNRIRAELKEAVRASNTPIRTRVSDITCLGVCPTARVSVAHVVPGQRVDLVTVAPDMTGAALLRHFRPDSDVSQSPE